MAVYEGVKYHIVRASTDIPVDQRISQLRKWCLIFHEKGLAPYYPGGTHGNMSFRVIPGKDEMIITAARSSFAAHLPDDAFFTVHEADLESMTLRISGATHHEPSSEALLHYAIYAKRPDVQAILHGHCAEITAMADGIGIPVTRQAVESGTLQIVEQVIQVIDDHPFVEIRDHGFISMSSSIEEAGLLAMDMMKRAIDHQRGKAE